MDANVIELAFHAGDLVGLIVVVAVMWTKLDAIKEAVRDHLKEDNARFDKQDKAAGELRGDLSGVSNRLSKLEGQLQ